MLFPPLISALVMLFFGLSALRLNARRPTNQVLAVVCLVSTLMFTMQLVARYYGAQYAIDHVSNPMPWVRLRYACIGFLCPLMVWACYYIVSGRFTSRRNLALKLIPWGIISLFLMTIPFTEAFKSSASRPDKTLDGPLYTVYFTVMLLCELAVCIASIVVAGRLRGIRRLEFRFITIAFGYLSLAAIVAALIHNFFRAAPLIEGVVRTLAVLVFIVFGVSAWSVTSRRVHHSTQVLWPLAQRCGLAAAVALIAVSALRLVPSHGPPWPAVTVIGIACAAFYFLDDKLREVLSLKSEQRIAVVGKQLQRASSGEFDPERLIEKFEIVLSRHVVGSNVRILTPELNSFERGDLVLAAEELKNTPLLIEGWVSTVSLARESKADATDALRARLEREHIHLLVSPHWNENEPGVIIAFDERENGLPFTYPEVRMLQALAEIVDGLYTRSRFSLQARQAEQLATIGLVGAGLAHELRNPIVAIDTFAQLLPKRLDDAQFLREFAEVIPGEAKRIQALADQLLDLSRPRKYEFVPIDVHDVIAESIFLVRQKAGTAQVSLEAEASATHSRIVADPQALRQVLLNLLLNSIQSIAQTKRPGHIWVRTADVGLSVVIETEDNGPGIPEAIRNRLFRPFASAGKAGGLGLGLAICAEIARVHQGEISAESRGIGALFRISLPVTGPNGLAHGEP